MGIMFYWKRKSLLTFFLVCIFSLSFSQDGVLTLKGGVAKGRDPLPNAKITLLQNSQEIKTLRTDRKGGFTIDMEINKKYTVKFSKEDFVSKKIFVDATVPGDQGGTWMVEFSVGLFKMYPGLDVSPLDKPITKIQYSERENGFTYDYNYTEKMMAKVDKILRELEKLKEEAYRKIIRQGDDHFDNKKYEEAIKYFEKALDQRPGDRYPKKRIEAAREQLEERKERQTLYEQTIALADKQFEEENYKEARKTYSEAIGYDSRKDYPRDQIRKIDDILSKLRAERQERQEKNRKYKAFIKTADDQFDNEKYSRAKGNYQKAMEIFPEKQYPKQKINKIEELLAQQQAQAERKQEYEKLITQADEFLNTEKYIQAKSKYNEALGVKPEETYPQDQIKKIDQILADRQEKERQYAEFIESADKAFQQEQLNNARKDYVKARNIKPRESYPQNQINKIDKILSEREAEQKEYEKYITQADKAFQTKNYQDAKSSYSEALFVKPNEQYPKDQIDQIDKILSERQAKQKNYKNAIAQADKYFEGERYTLAKNSYQRARSIKPSEQYPRDQIEKIENILQRQAQQEQKYNNLITEADNAFEKENYTSSKKKYQDALKIKSEAKYPQQQIRKIDKILAELKEKRQKQVKYNNTIEKADAAFKQEEYSSAKSLYSEALFIKPDEQYPQSQIDKIDQILSEQKAEKEQYANAINKADRYFDEEKYSQAKSAYQNALSIKPEEQYPQNQIDKINDLLARQAQIDSQYKTLVSKADDQFNAEQYEQSKRNYQKAVELKPNEQYPKQQIDKINGILSDLAEEKKENEEYNNKIQQADAAFDKENYKTAKSHYSEALFIKPDKQYPKDQIDKIDELLAQKAREKAQQEKQNKAYSEAIDRGDAMFRMEEYSQAKSAYNEALSIKPNETYPQERIDKINDILAEQEAEARAYENAIARGDELFNSEDYRQSKSAYNKALEIKPNESYPKDQINKIDNILARQLVQKREREAKNKKYQNAINTADQLFNARQYEDARIAYNQALKVKPEEEYPANKIDEIDRILAEKRREKEEAYNRAITKADNLMDSENYEKARSSYRDALDIKPDENYPENQINKIERILAEMKRKREEKARKERLYTEQIDKADNYYKKNDYYNAKIHYRKALEYKPDEQYPKNRLTLIERKLEDFERVQKPEDKKVAEKSNQQKEGPQKFNFDSNKARKAYLSKLAKEYPEGVTVENYDLGNRKIKRVIVNYDGVAKDYRKVKHSWGGTYYFRNGQDISKSVFRVETKERD
jgi:tetratricopeptide (TPR) repeat protein